MDFSEGTALEIVERLSAAYGVTTQKSLADCLGVPAANVSNWVQRDSVPGSAFVKCALDTGSDLHWLTKGKLANASIVERKGLPEGEALYNEIISNGGKPVLRRIMDAYGFTLQKQLCELLGISSGTVSTWVRRKYFPGDVVVTCALDTGVSLHWLATGKELSSKAHLPSEIGSWIPYKTLHGGILHDAGSWQIDLSFVSLTTNDPVFIAGNSGAWVVDVNIKEISNGKWLLGIDGKFDVYDVALMPGKKINVGSNITSFSCGIEDVNCYGRVVFSIEYNF